MAVQTIEANLNAETMVDLSKQQKIDAAWRQHLRESDTIPAEFWRRLRNYKQTLIRDAAMIERILQDDAIAIQFVKDAVERRGTKQRSALEKLRRTLPKARIKITQQQFLEVWWLSPSTPLLKTSSDPGESQQDCLLVCFLIVTPGKHGFNLFSQWAIEAADHATARYLERTNCDGEELGEALFAAGVNFMQADAEVVMRHLNKASTVRVSTQNGMFVGEAIGAQASGRKYFYMRSRTWKPNWMLHADETALPAAVKPEQTTLVWLWRNREDMAAPSLRKPTIPVPAVTVGNELLTGAYKAPDIINSFPQDHDAGLSKRRKELLGGARL